MTGNGNGMDHEPRYAVYFAPREETPLWRLGSAWLGRDAAADSVVDRPEVEGIQGFVAETITVPPRHYGFHGTLKAPFALHPDRDETDLLAAAERFVAKRTPFQVRLKVDTLSGFLALRPDGEYSALHELADECVRAFDPFRAPLGPGELGRRRKNGLTGAQDAHLLQWGYPYVFDQFRFHMTLTKKLPPETRAPVQTRLEALFAPTLAAPVPFDSICLFHQTDRTRPLRVLRRFAFG